ncbi:MAG: hypothetical protein WA194_08845 [Patescibacteria group bacterium]
METYDLPKYGQHEGGGHKGKYESHEGYRESRIRHAIERFPEAGASGGFSKVDFRCYSRTDVTGRSEQHEKIRDVLVGDRPHPLDSQLFGISGDGK